jgi:hypothetical protein
VRNVSVDVVNIVNGSRRIIGGASEWGHDAERENVSSGDVDSGVAGEAPGGGRTENERATKLRLLRGMTRV